MALRDPVKAREYQQLWRVKNADKIKQYRLDNLEEGRAYSREYGRRNAAQRAIKNREWILANPDKVAEQRKKYYAAHAKRQHDLRRERTTGFSPELFEFRLKEQSNRCAICHKTLIPGRKTHADHNHKTVQPRGILCQPCNHGIGNFKEDPVALVSAIEYLKRWSE